MEFEHERREARRLLDGIENGTMTAAESWTAIGRAEPVLVYLIVTWLRVRYDNDPASDGVFGRLAAILQAYPAFAGIMKDGEADSLVEWFEDGYHYRDLSADEFLRIVVEKLES